MSDLKLHQKRQSRIREQGKYEMEQSIKTTDARKTVLKSFFTEMETGTKK